MKIKVIANYLPQYHRIPENDLWWGEGYTDWVATKNAQPLFEGHRQPRIPLGNNYYDLSDIDTIRWQAELARKYGVYGFGIYHYWFNSDLQLLQKPAELLLQNKDIDINFMFLWDNTSWKRTWSNVVGNDWAPQYDLSKKNEKGILAQLEYGNERDWEKHFDYLLKFFSDDRYIKIDEKPAFVIMNPSKYQEFDILKRMVNFWNDLAIKEGLKGITILGTENWRNNKFDYGFRYMPCQCLTMSDALLVKVKKIFIKSDDKVQWFNYDKEWAKIIRRAKNSQKDVFLSGFVRFDDTARRGNKARIVLGSTPQKFQKYFTELLKISKQQGKEYVFCPAWNEWGEGMYLEPDTVDGYAYLEALKAAVDEVNGE